MLLDQLEEFPGVEQGGALHPRVEHVRRDRVELLSRRQQEMACIVDVQADFRVADDVEVVLGKIRGRDPRHQRLDLRDDFVLDAWIDGYGSRGHAGAASDDQHRPRASRHERREMSEHPLEPHVLRLARRLHLARVVVVAHTVAALRHGDRGVPALADVDDLGLPDLGGRIPAECHEHARQHGHGESQQRGGDGRRGDKRGGCALLPQHHQRRQRCDDDQQLLRALAPEPHDQHEARAERPDDRPERVGGVNAAHDPRRILVTGRDRGQREREAGAPENRAGQHGKETSGQIELKLDPEIGRDRRVDRPVRQGVVEKERSPGHRGTQQQLAPGEGNARAREAAPEHRAQGAADADARQEHGEDERKGIGRRPEQQRERPRPLDFGRQRGQS